MPADKKEVVAKKLKFPEDFDIDCGSCGAEIGWPSYIAHDYKCPTCGWDSIRVYPKKQS